MSIQFSHFSYKLQLHIIMSVTYVTFNSRKDDEFSLQYWEDRLPGSQEAVTVDIKMNVVDYILCVTFTCIYGSVL